MSLYNFFILQDNRLYFALQPQPTTDINETTCFVAKDDAEFDMWTDGINVLLGNEVMVIYISANGNTNSCICKLN